MREMRGEVGKKTPKKRWRIPHLYYVTGIKSGAKVVQIGLRQILGTSIIYNAISPPSQYGSYLFKNTLTHYCQKCNVLVITLNKTKKTGPITAIHFSITV